LINILDEFVKSKLATMLLPLADKLVSEKTQRYDLLCQEGWRRHLVGDEIKKTYCDNFLEEDELYGIEPIKFMLGLGRYNSTQYDRYIQTLRSRKLPCTIKWDEQKMFNPNFENEIANRGKEIRGNACQTEIKRFGASVIPTKINSEEEFDAFIISEVAKALPGFSFDKSMSIGKKLLALTKPCHLPWKWVLMIDKGDLDSTFKRCAVPDGNGGSKQVKDFENGYFGITFIFNHAKNKRESKIDQLIYLPPIYPDDSRIYYTSHTELCIHLKYNLRCYAEMLAWFDEPIRKAFEELEAEGYSN
jgi:hypothetical protein